MLLLKEIAKRYYVSTSKDLSSFLKQNDKNVASTVYRGTLFELQTMEALTTATGMELQHVGGKSDGGIDLRGQWFNNTNIIIQCKNTKQGCTPDHIRELMGTVLASSAPKRKTVGILSTISHKPFTQDVISHFNSSPVSLGLVTVQDAKLMSIMFNKRALKSLKGLLISTEYDAEGNQTLFVNVPSSSSSNKDEK